MRARLLLGLGVLAVAGVALVAVFRPAAPATAPVAFQSSTECRACHAEVYGEWESSWHARSWTDPDVRALSNDFANTDCIDCHAQRPVFETGLEERVLPRAARRVEGVDCIACHALAGPDAGRVAGTLERDDVACRPRAVPELSSAQFCAPCHNQHQTVTEWLASRYAAEGIDCIDCHMPFRGGDPNRGRDHTMHGGHSIELVRSAVALRARRNGAEVVVEVENVGAGHSFPTDERSRAADVFWRPLTEPRGPWRHLYRFRSPYRDEVGLTSTLLVAHETRPIPLADPEAGGPIEVALFYKLSPYWQDPERPDPEREASLVHRLELAP
ncbi:MAG TPA: multiheme c-type cytochrome [Planctomycetota bacterium]